MPHPHCAHVGSLLRPAPLLESLNSPDTGDAAALRKTEDAAIQQAIKLQRDIGLRTITDGELRRKTFFDGVFENLDGMVYVPARPMSEWMTYIPHIKGLVTMGVPAMETYYCEGKITRTKPFYVEQFKYVKSVVPDEEIKNIKVNVCSPSWYHQRHGSEYTYNHDVYKTDDEYFDDLAVAYRAEFKELYDLGCRHIQIDDPTFVFFCSATTPADMEAAGINPDKLLATYVRAINVCTADRPSDLHISLHMCRGNYMGQHFMEGSYDWIAEKVFPTLDVDTLYLEYDDERSGGFTPLKHVPLNKSIVLGLVSTKNNEIEDAEVLKGRILEAAEAMTKGSHKRTKEEALQQLAISPQCGFASVWQGNPISEEVQRKKLELVAAVAKEIWQ